MPRNNSQAADMLKSFLPESYLKKQRNVWALSYKYEVRLGLESAPANRLLYALFLSDWAPPKSEPIATAAHTKFLDGLTVLCGDPATFCAYDPKVPEERIEYGAKDALLLGVSTLKGAHHFRGQLAVAANYINAHESLRQTRYIAGVTHPAMGKLALAFGFRRMEPEHIDGFERDESYAIHLGYCAVNNRPAVPKKEYEPAVVYLPTQEFVQRFSTEAVGVLNPAR